MDEEKNAIEAEILPAPPQFKTATGKNKRQDVINYLNAAAAGSRISDTAKAVELYAKGLSAQEIANATNTNVNTVQSRLNPFKSLFKFLSQSEDYNLVKSKLLDAAEYQLLSLMLDKGKLKRAGLSAVSGAFREIHNANRLTKGLSTENSARMTIKFTSSAKIDDFKEDES